MKKSKAHEAKMPKMGKKDSGPKMPMPNSKGAGKRPKMKPC
jgi:hypothetical protein